MPTIPVLGLALFFTAVSLTASSETAMTSNDEGAEIKVRSFMLERPMCRAQRPATIMAVIDNMGDEAVNIEARLLLPASVKSTGAGVVVPLRIGDADSGTARWEVLSDSPGDRDFGMEILKDGVSVAASRLTVTFLAPVEEKKLDYIPAPEPVKSKILVGAHNCPLWESDKPEMWTQILKHPERTPALGFYSQENPEVADWETKWAAEHGVDFFIYCWYRKSQGGPVEMNFGSAIHDAFFKSRFVNNMKFTIMWENQSRGIAGVSDEKDLMENLFPFWMKEYFKHPSYLVVDNKPVLFVYRPEFLVDDLGSVENVVKAFDLMRQACRDAGFDGLYILGEYRGLDAKQLTLLKSLGLDYSFAYCWHIQDNPTPEVAINTQIGYIKKTQELGILPQVVTVSQAWSGWSDEGSIWKIPPQGFETLLRRAYDIIQTFPKDELGSKMIILDNWNEWGEGHYIAPYREYGFGYLDAVRNALTTAPAEHTDLLPEDIGMGPYDTAYKEWSAKSEELRGQLARKAVKPGADEKGLVAWWAFDEALDADATLDYSGNRMGGRLHDASRAPGIDGAALVCEGGCAEVAANPRLSIAKTLSISCWVKTSLAGQGNTWFLNRVLSGGTSTGYRMGILDGFPCFEIPVTDFSHHLSASKPLPVDRWVHLAGTFDGSVMRIYMDGEELGSMERPGPINPNVFNLYLGTFCLKHEAHFTGLLDEVKLYDRALTPEEIQAKAREFAK